VRLASSRPPDLRLPSPQTTRVRLALKSNTSEPPLDDVDRLRRRRERRMPHAATGGRNWPTVQGALTVRAGSNSA
jgi:hypothetical protein